MPNSGLQALSSALADAVQTASASLVTVDARPRFPASGVVTAPGLVLTASHVVQADEIKVTLPDGEELTAELLGRDPHSDLAVLKLSAAKGAAAQTNTSPQVGQLALALGRPTSEGAQASLGIVSAIGGPLRSHHGGLLESYLRTDAIPYPGFSGGPLVDAEGRVLGLNTSGLGMGASLTIPAKLAWTIAKAIEEHGGVKRGYLGIAGQPVTLPQTQRGEAEQREEALLVTAVTAGSPAAGAGLLVGDVILAFDGAAIESPEDLLDLLVGDRVGRKATLHVLRGGAARDIVVDVGERPS